MSAGFTLRIVGGKVSSAADWPLAALIAARMSLAAPSTLRLRSNCRRDRGEAERARRRHLRQARDLAELLLERRRDGRRHGLRIGARQLRGDLDRRVVDVRQRRDRQQRIGRKARTAADPPSAWRSRSAAR